MPWTTRPGAHRRNELRPVLRSYPARYLLAVGCGTTTYKIGHRSVREQFSAHEATELVAVRPGVRSDALTSRPVEGRSPQDRRGFEAKSKRSEG